MATTPPVESVAAPATEATPARPRVKGPRRITFRVLLFLVLLGGLAYGAWYVIKVYVGDSYFVGLQKNELVIYQGRPGGFLGLEPKIVDHTGVTTAEVGSIVVPALQKRRAGAVPFGRQPLRVQAGGGPVQSPESARPPVRRALPPSPPRRWRPRPPPREGSDMARRIRWLGVGMVICFFILFLQLNNIEVVKAHQYATDPNNPAVVAQAQQPRGVIQSADGAILAKTVLAPKGSANKYERIYPEQWATLFSGVVGVDSPRYSEYGVEASYNSYLMAHNQPGHVAARSAHHRHPHHRHRHPHHLDHAAGGGPKRSRAARSGAVVALDPQTGAVLAMYSNPTYDPNLLASLNPNTESFAFTADNTRNAAGFDPLTSLAYQDAQQFGPGSTFKIVTTAAAYDRAPQLVNTPIPNFTTIPANYFQGQSQSLSNDDFENCGGTIAVMLPVSCDTGYAILGTKIGAAAMTAEADGFGFNQQPPIDLPHAAEEVSNFLQPSCYQNAQVFLAYSSIGQKCTQASPLQMAMVAAAFADDGTIMTPHVMDQIRDSDGNLVEKYQPTAWKQATSPATAQAVNLLMQTGGDARDGRLCGISPPGRRGGQDGHGPGRRGQHQRERLDDRLRPRQPPHRGHRRGHPEHGDLQSRRPGGRPGHESHDRSGVRTAGMTPRSLAPAPFRAAT